MNDKEFHGILDQLSEYLTANKTFTPNPFRETELKNALTTARELFPNAKIELKDDPLQTGAMILRIEDFEISATGEREINLFSELIKHADNFEIYPIDDDNVRCAIVFQNVMVRI